MLSDTVDRSIFRQLLDHMMNVGKESDGLCERGKLPSWKTIFILFQCQRSVLEEGGELQIGSTICCMQLHAKEKDLWRWGNQHQLLYWAQCLLLVYFWKAFLLHSLRLRFHHNTQGHAGWPGTVLGSIIFLLHFSPETDNKFTSWRCT